MSDDYEDRIREDWRYTYKVWDAADDQRRLEREHEITRHSAEGARLDREIERAKQAQRLKELSDTFQQKKKRLVDRLDRIDTSVVPISDKTEWRQELERIDVHAPAAKLELETLLEKVRIFKSTWPEVQQFRVSIEFPHLRGLLGEELKRKIQEAQEHTLKSVVSSIESSLEQLVSLCEEVKRAG
jgi:hypothetical protein